ncbi:MAG: hypothetical protein ABI905_14205 [Betaproteobacteria bacterium]
MSATKLTSAKASPQPPLPPKIDQRQEETDKPQGNATRPLQKSDERQDAEVAQSVLQKKGPNALPVSDYPLKDGSNSANTIDKRHRRS